MDAESERSRFTDRWERTVCGDSSNDDSVTKSRTIVRSNRHYDVTTDFTLESRAEVDFEAAQSSVNDQVLRYVDRREQTTSINDDIEGGTSRRVLIVRRRTSPLDLSSHSSHNIAIKNSDREIHYLDLFSLDHRECSKLLRRPSDITADDSTHKRRAGSNHADEDKDEGKDEGKDKGTGESAGEYLEHSKSNFELRNLSAPDTSEVIWLPCTDRWERTEGGPDDRPDLLSGVFHSQEYSWSAGAVSGFSGDGSAINYVRHDDENEQNVGMKTVQHTVDRFVKNCEFVDKHQTSHAIPSKMEYSTVDNDDICNVAESLASHSHSWSSVCPGTIEVGEQSEVNIVVGKTTDNETLRISRDTKDTTSKYLDDGKTVVTQSTLSDLEVNEARALSYTDRWERTEAVDDFTDNQRVLVHASHTCGPSGVLETVSSVGDDDGGMIKLKYDERKETSDNLVEINDDCLSSREEESKRLVSSRLLEKRKTVQVDQAGSGSKHTSYLNLSVGSAASSGQPMIVSEVNTDFSKTIDTEVFLNRREDDWTFISELHLNLVSNCSESEGSVDYYSADMSSDTIMTGDSIGTFVETGDSMYTSYSSDSFVEQAEAFNNEVNSLDYDCANLNTVDHNMLQFEIGDADSLYLCDIAENDFQDAHSDYADKDAVNELQHIREYQEDISNHDENNLSVNMLSCQESKEGSQLLLPDFKSTDSSVLYNEETSVITGVAEDYLWGSTSSTCQTVSNPQPSTIAEQNVTSEDIHNDCQPVSETSLIYDVPRNVSEDLSVRGEAAVNFLRDAPLVITVEREANVNVLRDVLVDLTVGGEVGGDIHGDASVNLTVGGEVGGDIHGDASVNLTVGGEVGGDIHGDASVDLTVVGEAGVDIHGDASVDQSMVGEAGVDIHGDASVDLTVVGEAGVDIHGDASVDQSLVGEAGVDIHGDASVDLTVGGEAGGDNHGDASVDLTVGGEVGVSVLRDASVDQSLGGEAGVEDFDGFIQVTTRRNKKKNKKKQYEKMVVTASGDDDIEQYVSDCRLFTAEIMNDTLSETTHPGSPLGQLNAERAETIRVEHVTFSSHRVEPWLDIHEEVINNFKDELESTSIQASNTFDEGTELRVRNGEDQTEVREAEEARLEEEKPEDTYNLDEKENLGDKGEYLEVILEDMKKEDEEVKEQGTDTEEDDINRRFYKKEGDDIDTYVRSFSNGDGKNINIIDEERFYYVDGDVNTVVTTKRRPSESGDMDTDERRLSDVDDINTEVIDERRLSDVDDINTEVIDERRLSDVDDINTEVIDERRLSDVDDINTEVIDERRLSDVDDINTKVIDERRLSDVDDINTEVIDERRLSDVDDINTEVIDERRPSDVDDINIEVIDERRPSDVDYINTEVIDERRPSDVDDINTEDIDERRPSDVDYINTKVIDARRPSDGDDINIDERRLSEDSVMKTEVTDEKRPEDGDMNTEVTDESRPSEDGDINIDERRPSEYFDINTEVTDESRPSEDGDINIDERRPSEDFDINTEVTVERRPSEDGDMCTDERRFEHSAMYKKTVIEAEVIDSGMFMTDISSHEVMWEGYDEKKLQSEQEKWLTDRSDEEIMIKEIIEKNAKEIMSKNDQIDRSEDSNMPDEKIESSEESKWEDRRIEESKWEDEKIEESKWEDEKIKESKWEDEKIESSEESKWEEGKIKESKWEDEKIEESKWEDERIEESKWEEGKIEESKWEEERSEESKWEDERIEESKLEDERIEESKWEDERIEESKLEDEKIEESKLEDEKIQESKWEDERIEESKWEDERIEESKWEDDRIESSEESKWEEGKIKESKWEDERIEESKWKDERIEESKWKDERIEESKWKDERIERSEESKWKDERIEESKWEGERIERSEESKWEEERIEESKWEEERIEKSKWEEERIEKSKWEEERSDESKWEEERSEESTLEEEEIEISEESKWEEERIEESKLEEEKIERSEESKWEDERIEESKWEDDRIESSEESKWEEGKIKESKWEDERIEESKWKDERIEESKLEDEKIEESKEEDERIEESKWEDERIEECKLEDERIEKSEESKWEEERIEESKWEDEKSEESTLKEEKIEISQESKWEEERIEESKLEEEKIERSEESKWEDERIEESKWEDDRIESSEESKWEEGKIKESKWEDERIEESKWKDERIEECKLEDEKIERSEESKWEEERIEESKWEDEKSEESTLEEEEIEISEESKWEEERIEESKWEEERIEKSKWEDERIEESKWEEERIEKSKWEEERSEESKWEEERSEESTLEEEKIERSEESKLEDERIEESKFEEEKIGRSEISMLEEERSEESKFEEEKSEESKLEEERIEESKLEEERIEESKLEEERSEESKFEEEKSEESKLEEERIEESKFEEEKSEESKLEEEKIGRSEISMLEEERSEESKWEDEKIKKMDEKTMSEGENIEIRDEETMWEDEIERSDEEEKYHTCDIAESCEKTEWMVDEIAKFEVYEEEQMLQLKSFSKKGLEKVNDITEIEQMAEETRTVKVKENKDYHRKNEIEDVPLVDDGIALVRMYDNVENILGIKVEDVDLEGVLYVKTEDADSEGRKSPEVAERNKMDITNEEKEVSESKLKECILIDSERSESVIFEFKRRDSIEVSNEAVDSELLQIWTEWSESTLNDNFSVELELDRREVFMLEVSHEKITLSRPHVLSSGNRKEHVTSIEHSEIMLSLIEHLYNAESAGGNDISFQSLDVTAGVPAGSIAGIQYGRQEDLEPIDLPETGLSLPHTPTQTSFTHKLDLVSVGSVTWDCTKSVKEVLHRADDASDRITNSAPDNPVVCVGDSRMEDILSDVTILRVANMKTESEGQASYTLDDSEKSVTEAVENIASEVSFKAAEFDNLNVQQRDSDSEIDVACREMIKTQLASSAEQSIYQDTNTSGVSGSEISVNLETSKFDIETVESDINESGCMTIAHNFHKDDNVQKSVQRPSSVCSSELQSGSNKGDGHMKNMNIDTVDVSINDDLDDDTRDSSNIFVDRQEHWTSPTSTAVVITHIVEDVIRNKSRAKQIVTQTPFVCQGQGHLASEMELLEIAARDQLNSLKMAVSEDEKYKTEILSLKTAIEEAREDQEKSPVTVTSVEALKEQINKHSDTIEADFHKDSASFRTGAAHLRQYKTQTENRAREVNLSMDVLQEQVQFNDGQFQLILQRQASYQQSVRDLTIKMEQICSQLVAHSTVFIATTLDTQIGVHKNLLAEIASVKHDISQVRNVGEQLVHSSNSEVHKTMEATLTMLVDSYINMETMADTRGKQLEDTLQIKERQAFALKAYQKRFLEIYNWLEENKVHQESINLPSEAYLNLQLQLDENRELHEDINNHLQQISDLVVQCDILSENETPVSSEQLHKELADLQSAINQFKLTTVKKYSQLCAAIKENGKTKQEEEIDFSIQRLQKWADDTKELAMTSGSQAAASVTDEQIYVQKELASDIKIHRQLFSHISDQRWHETPISSETLVSEEEIRDSWVRLHGILIDKKDHLETIMRTGKPMELVAVSRMALARQGDCVRQFEAVKNMLADVSNSWKHLPEQLTFSNVFTFNQQYQSALQNISSWLDLTQQQLFIVPMTIDEQIRQNENLQRQLGLFMREISEFSKQGEAFLASRDLTQQHLIEMCLEALSKIVKLLKDFAHSQLEDLHQSERQWKQFKDEVAGLQKLIKDTQELVLVPTSSQSFDQLLSDSQKLDIWLKQCETQLDMLKNKESNFSQHLQLDVLSELTIVHSSYMELHRMVMEKKVTVQNLLSVQDQYQKMLNNYAVFLDTAQDKLRMDSVNVRDISHLRQQVASHKDFFCDLEVHKAILDSLASQCDSVTKTKFQQQHSLLINLTLDLVNQASLHGQKLERLTSQWTEHDNKFIRLDKVLFAIEQKMPQPIATGDSLTIVQNKYINYKHLQSELDTQRNTLLEVLDEGKQILLSIKCPALEDSVIDLSNKWMCINANVSQELKRTEALSDQLSVFETEATILSSWLHTAKLKLARFMQHSSQDLQNIRTIRTRREEILDFCKEMERQLYLKNKVVAVGTRLMQNKDCDTRGVSNRLNDYEEEWTNLEAGISQTQKYLHKAEIDLIPFHQALHELSASVEKISESLELDGSKRNCNGAEMELLVKNLKEYKIELGSMQMMLDSVNQQVLASLTDENNASEEKLKYAENFRKLDNGWKKVMTDVTNRLKEFEDVQTKWEEYEKALERLQAWLCAQESKIQHYKLIGHEVAVKFTLKELNATQQQLQTKQTDMISLKTLASSLIELGSPGCQVSVVNSFCTLDHNWDGIVDQTRQLEAFLTDALGQWNSYNTDLTRVNQILTQTEYALSQYHLIGGDMATTSSQMLKLKELQSHLHDSTALLESLSVWASQLKQVCEPNVQAYIQKTVSNVQANWKQLSNNLVARCNQFEQCLFQWQEFEDQYSRICDWLDFWETLNADLINMRDDTQTPASLTQCQNLQKDLDNRQSQISELYRAIDFLTQNMHPSAISILTSRQSVIEQRMLTLRQKLSIHTATLTKDLTMFGRFNKAFDAVKNFLSYARDSLASLDPTKVEKEEDIQSRYDEVKQLLLQFSVNTVKLDEVNDLGYHLALDEVNATRLQELNHEWQEQYKDANNRIRILQANLLLHQDFTSKCDMWMTFLAQTEQDLTLEKTENLNDLLDQLNKCEQCESEMYNREQILHSIISDGEKMLRAGEVGDRKFHEKLHLLSEQWQSMSRRASQRKAVIKKEISKWQQFNLLCQQLKDWLHDKEDFLKTLECDTKSLQFIINLKEKIQTIKHEFKLQESTYQRMNDLGKSLLQHTDKTAAERTKATLLDCHRHWDKVVTALENYQSQLEGEHQQWLECERNIEDILDWLKNIRSHLHTDIPTTYDALQTDLCKCSDIAADFLNSEAKRQFLLAKERQLGRFIQTEDMSLFYERIQLLIKQWVELQQQTHLRKLILTEALWRWSNLGERTRTLVSWTESMTGKVESVHILQVEDLLIRLTHEYKEEVTDKELEKNDIMEEGRQLMKVSSEIQATDIEQKLLCLEDKWQHLKEVMKFRQQKLEGVLMAVKQLDTNMKSLSQWFSFVENKLSEEVLFNDIELKEIQEKLQESQELQHDIEHHSADVSAVLTLCEVLLHDSDACPTDVEYKALHHAMKTLMKRWQLMCALSPQKRNRIEETWQLWKTFIKDHDRFSDWMSLAEQDMREFEIDVSNLKVPKESVSKYEYLQCNVRDHLSDLGHIDRQYRQLIRERRADPSGCLKLRMTLLNNRWNALQLRLTKIMDKMCHSSAIKEDFETTRTSLIKWLTEMDTQLTSVKHLSDLELQTKITEIRNIEDEFISKHYHVEHLDQTAVYLIEKGNTQEALRVQHELDDFRAFYKSVKCNVSSFWLRIDPIIDTQTEYTTTPYSEGLQYFQSPAGPLRFLRSTQVTYEKEKMPTNLEQSLALQRAHTMKFVSDASPTQFDLIRSSLTSSPILIDGSPIQSFRDGSGCGPAQSVRSAKIEALLEPLVESLSDCDAKLAQLETPVTSHTSTEQSMHFLMECEKSVEHVQRLDYLLKSETGLATIDSTDAEVMSVLQRWENIQKWTKKHKFGISQEKHDLINFASDIDNMLVWLNEADALQSTHQSLPSDITRLDVVVRQFKDFQVQMESKRATVLTINQLSEKYLGTNTAEVRQLREKLDVMNYRWQQVIDRTNNIKKDIQVSLIQCQFFHPNIHDYEVWLEKTENSIHNCEPDRPDEDNSSLWRKYNRLIEISGELQHKQTKVMSLKETADQLFVSAESPEMLTARNKIYAVNSSMHTLMNMTSSYISALERRLQVTPSQQINFLPGIMPPMLRSTAQERDNLTTELETEMTALQHTKSTAVPALLMRVIRAALPLYLLFLLFFLLFCLIPVCEDEYQCMFSNHLRHSMSPMLRYTDGAPPT